MQKTRSGFTIVELLIVIVVIAILAAISVVAYNGVQERARQSQIEADLTLLEKAISAARVSNNTSFRYITLNTHTSGGTNGCYTKANGTDLAALPSTDPCWSIYATSLQRIYDASGVDVRKLKDPWGRPYYIDENEAEASSTSCSKDKIAVFALPHVANSQSVLRNQRLIPNYLSNC